MKLHGFNNLTKTLGCNSYDVCYTATSDQRSSYIEYIDEVYNAARLTHILRDLAHTIGANILNVAHQDYDPQGASVTMLIAEEPVAERLSDCVRPGPLPDAIVAHLDKSHLTVHTYPESHPASEISTFRVDIEVSTCGSVSPLEAVDYLVHAFGPDVLTLDYRVRGFTRDVDGARHFIDHPIRSVQDYLSPDTRRRYHRADVNLQRENLFHTKMMIRDFMLDDHLFGADAADLSTAEYAHIRGKVRREMVEIFHGGNPPSRPGP